MMTKQRALEILQTAKDTATPGTPWVDNIHLSELEDDEVCKVWERMPGTASYIDALNAIAEGRFHGGSEPPVSTIPTDYETCGECGFDHAYEPQKAHAYHSKND